MKKFTKDHEWVQLEGDLAVVGITNHAQAELGDIVFVELPEIGASFSFGEEAAVIESVKAAGEVKAPVSGEVVEVNQSLADNPSLINQAAESGGWVYKAKLSAPQELETLMNEAEYKKYIGG